MTETKIISPDRGGFFASALAFFLSVQCALVALAALASVFGLVGWVVLGLYKWHSLPHVTFDEGTIYWITSAIIGFAGIVGMTMMAMIFAALLSILPAGLTAFLIATGGRELPGLERPIAWSMIGLSCALVFSTIYALPLVLFMCMVIFTIGAQYPSLRNPVVWPLLALPGRIMMQPETLHYNPAFIPLMCLLGAVGGYYAGRAHFRSARGIPGARRCRPAA